ncbi:putative regulator of Ras-like GTPase activity (Roadblock/LC7/MglB family) [Flavobacterium sp. 2755]|nr:carboxypeptidase-like regulatory domain-containing protein [Flavobacterium sp. 2755]MDR6764292.1 putative regulator of Ras-like GTPase activity (Roadblock/LC7/MglB family) [Flavobacterium sp. 2755]
MSFGQEKTSKEIFGQILEQSSVIEGINIINTATQRTAVSDKNGRFSIEVKEGDVLIFSAVDKESVKHRITAEDFNLALIQIKMKAGKIELKEVVINENAHINAVNLGIVSKDQKKYTPAERKLATAGDFKAISLLGLLGGSVAIDPILNKINGRTKMLKKNVQIEKKEIALEKLGALFEDEYFINELKIPSDYISGFKFYLVENEEIMLLLGNKEKAKLKLLIYQQALKYNEIIASEVK